MGHRKIGVDPEGLLQVADAFVPTAHGTEVHADAVVGRAGLGPHRQRRAVEAKGFIVPRGLEQGPAQLEVEPEVLRVTCLRRAQQGNRITPRLEQDPAQGGRQLRGQLIRPQLLDEPRQPGTILPQLRPAQAVP